MGILYLVLPNNPRNPPRSLRIAGAEDQQIKEMEACHIQEFEPTTVHSDRGVVIALGT